MQDEPLHSIERFKHWTSLAEGYITTKDFRLKQASQKIIFWAENVQAFDSNVYEKEIYEREMSILFKSTCVIYELYSSQYLMGSAKHGHFTKIKQEKLASFVYQFTVYLLPLLIEINDFVFIKKTINDFIDEHTPDLFFQLRNLGDHELKALLDLISNGERVGIENIAILRKQVESEIIRRQLDEQLYEDLAGESIQVEYKAEIPLIIKLAKEIAAFSSTEGGRIYLGISDDGTVLGIACENKWLDKLQQDIMNMVCENIKPTPTLSVKAIDVGGKKIVQITVPKGSEPIYYLNNVPYVRKLTTSRPATPSDVKNIHLNYFFSTLKHSTQEKE